MKYLTKLPVVILAAVLITACEQKGPIEKAGENVDEAIEDVRDEGKDLGNKIEDVCEDLKEELGAEDQDC